MFNLDGGEPEPEKSALGTSDVEDFAKEAERFREKRKARRRDGTPRHVGAWVIGAVLFGGFLLAAYEAMGPEGCSRPAPAPSAPEPP